jgi:hypothetical protein
MVIHQARTYLAGAVSGAALIAAAVVAFVLLVSVQGLRDWPLAGLGGGDESGSVSPAQPVTAPAAGDSDAVAGGASPADADPVGGGAGEPAGGGGGIPAGAGTPPPSPGGETPVSSRPGSGATGGPAPGRRRGGSQPQPQPASTAPSPSGTIAGAVNGTIAGVDRATGGALGRSGVKKATEGVVNGVAGPQSSVGKTVDEVAEKAKGTVGGLLGGGR